MSNPSRLFAHLLWATVTPLYTAPGAVCTWLSKRHTHHTSCPVCNSFCSVSIYPAVFSYSRATFIRAAGLYSFNWCVLITIRLRFDFSHACKLVAVAKSCRQAQGVRVCRQQVTRPCKVWRQSHGKHVALTRFCAWKCYGKRLNLIA
jgi:hypothetical protein